MTAIAKDKIKINDPQQLIDPMDQLRGDIASARESIGRVIFGQPRVIEETMITLLTGGHLLLIGVPGLGKTRLVETLVWGIIHHR
ncbi:MAG TPA: hypothetical protein QF509_07060 [Rhodospirillales bacterium]|nr:hypothetical protein [Rhodospirillales bacterium]